MRVEKFTEIHSTTSLTLTTSPVDYSSSFPTEINRRLGVAVIFEGDNDAGAVYIGDDANKRFKIPTGEYVVFDAMDLANFLRLGQLNVWAEVGAETVTMTVAIVGG